jgi:hypothetical protein
MMLSATYPGMDARNNTTQIWLDRSFANLDRTIMCLISRLLGCVAFLSIAMSSAQAELRDRAGALDWQTFRVPNYGTRVEYPATIFVAMREQKRASGSDLKAKMAARFCPSTLARMRTTTHLLVTLERICDKGASITNA